MAAPFIVLYGISYFFTQFGPNTTTLVYPAELFPVAVRTTGHGISAAAGKQGVSGHAISETLPSPPLPLTRLVAEGDAVE
jgi:hypothetical protein